MQSLFGYRAGVDGLFGRLFKEHECVAVYRAKILFIRLHIAFEHFFGQCVLDFALNGAFQRARTLDLVKARVGDFINRFVGKIDGNIERCRALFEVVEQAFCDFADFLLLQAFKHDNVIDTV